jgi:hypothetical protein
LRKLILTIGMAAVLALVTASVTQAATHHPKAKSGLCNTGVPGGNQYHPACTAPKLTFTPPTSPGCVNAGPGYKLPNLTFVSNAGLKEIQILVGGTVVKTITFSGGAKSQYVLDGYRLKTAGLASGAHVVTIEVTDARNKSVKKTLNFTICAAKPVFTG